MEKYRKIPAEIKALQLTKNTVADICGWIGWIREGGYVSAASHDPVYIKIQTLEGVMTADEFDFIIRGVAGEFYPCKPEIFKQTYEKV